MPMASANLQLTSPESASPAAMAGEARRLEDLEEKKKEKLKELQLWLPDKEHCGQSPEVVQAQPEKPSSVKIASHLVHQYKEVQHGCMAIHTKGPHMNKQEACTKALEETDLNSGADKASSAHCQSPHPPPENPHTHTFLWVVIYYCPIREDPDLDQPAAKRLAGAGRGGSWIPLVAKWIPRIPCGPHRAWKGCSEGRRGRRLAFRRATGREGWGVHAQLLSRHLPGLML